MKPGDKVVILGCKRTLVRPTPNIEGGWEVDRPVEGFRYWNIDSMGSYLSINKALAAANLSKGKK